MEPQFVPNRTDGAVKDNYSCNVSGSASALTTSSLLLCIFAGCLSFLILCGNLLVIVSIMYFKQLHSATNYLILSLAMTDLLVGVFILPFSTALSVRACGRLQASLCSVRGSLDMLLVTSSLLNLGCISIDRYYAVCQPLRYRQTISVFVIAIMVVTTWTVSAVMGIGVTISGLNRSQPDERCVLFQKSRSTIMGAVIAFYLPAIVMSSIYQKIWRVARRQARSIHSKHCKVSKMEKKATRTLTVVLGVFLTCWTPFFFCVTISPLSSIPTPVFETLKWLGWSNSMLNPLVYGFFYSWFRSAFGMILTGKIFQGDFSNSKLF